MSTGHGAPSDSQHLRSLTRDVRPQIEPTPAAAPSLGPNSKSDRQLQGVLKVVVGPNNHIFYLKFPDGGSICTLTTNANEAIRVRCSSISSTTVLERIVSAGRTINSIATKRCAYVLKIESPLYFVVGSTVVLFQLQDTNRVHRVCLML